MSGHVFRVVSGAPRRTLLTSLWLATASTPRFSARLNFGAAGVGFVFLGIPTYGHVDLNSFLKFGQGGLVDWSRRWPALVSCVRPWGFRCFGHMSLNSFPKTRSTAPTDKVVSWLFQGRWDRGVVRTHTHH